MVFHPTPRTSFPSSPALFSFSTPNIFFFPPPPLHHSYSPPPLHLFSTFSPPSRFFSSRPPLNLFFPLLLSTTSTPHLLSFSQPVFFISLRVQLQILPPPSLPFQPPPPAPPTPPLLPPSRTLSPSHFLFPVGQLPLLPRPLLLIGCVSPGRAPDPSNVSSSSPQQTRQNQRLLHPPSLFV